MHSASHKRVVRSCRSLVGLHRCMTTSLASAHCGWCSGSPRASHCPGTVLPCAFLRMPQICSHVMWRRAGVTLYTVVMSDTQAGAAAADAHQRRYLPAGAADGVPCRPLHGAAAACGAEGGLQAWVRAPVYFWATAPQARRLRGIRSCCCCCKSQQTTGLSAYLQS
jgi:hypothetical protein